MGRRKGSKNRPKTDDQAPQKQFCQDLMESDRALFMHYLPHVVAVRAAVQQAVDAEKLITEQAKEHGFTKSDFDYAIDVQSPAKEAKTRAMIRRRLLIARFVGSSLGNQLNLFEETPAVRIVQPTPAPIEFHSESLAGNFVPFTADELETQQTLADEASKH